MLMMSTNSNVRLNQIDSTIFLYAVPNNLAIDCVWTLDPTLSTPVPTNQVNKET